MTDNKDISSPRYYDRAERLSLLDSLRSQRATRPVIGLTANFKDSEARLAKAYYESVAAAGATPVLLPPYLSADDILPALESIDALVLTGGADINPLYLAEEPERGLRSINSERDAAELLLTRATYRRGMPVLGICRGIQTLTAALDGDVIQDIGSRPDADRHIKHEQDAPRYTPTHTIRIEADSLLHSIYGEDRIMVNSFHHQAVGSTGEHLRAVAFAPDGIIEAVESRDFKPVIGVQWHPEWMGHWRDTHTDPLFTWLATEASLYHRACAFHLRNVTLDSHCDTPMLFDEGVDLNLRDRKALVDLRKMDEGHLDTVIMAAYLPQGPRSEEGLTKATAEATRILTAIDAHVAAAPDAAMARTPSELKAIKARGMHPIMKAIENGYAIGRDISNVRRFAGMGVVYITLCHNGDNDICDSASKTLNEHGGVSAFGEQVIREMNRSGIMVDLSHGGEKSFYDAMDISSLPIVCSHASARALCDHPRNLTDDQLRALARKGGVAQVTFYHGFLRLEGEATVLDALAHLDHFVEVAGIEHVGIGSDFDGDGGVRGLASASDMAAFTAKLLRKRYSEDDLRLIWGGNFLRVMQQVQDAAAL